MLSAPGFISLQQGLGDLLRFERGHARFELGDDNDLEYRHTEATVKMFPGEELVAFIGRLKQEHGLQKGDVLELLNNGRGACDTARVIKQRR